MAQMPTFKRYYIADTPEFTWPQTAYCHPCQDRPLASKRGVCHTPVIVGLWLFDPPGKKKAHDPFTHQIPMAGKLQCFKGGVGSVLADSLKS